MIRSNPIISKLQNKLYTSQIFFIPPPETKPGLMESVTVDLKIISAMFEPGKGIHNYPFPFPGNNIGYKIPSFFYDILLITVRVS
jgi:hypothetical protein